MLSIQTTGIEVGAIETVRVVVTTLVSSGAISTLSVGGMVVTVVVISD